MAVQALVNGQVDAVIIDNLPAAEYVKANPGLTTLEGTWVEEDYAIGVQKGNTELLNAVNGALNELKADGTFQGIVDRYITAQNHCNQVREDGPRGRPPIVAVYH